MKYRIVKQPMWRVVGLVEWHGYTECYTIEKKTWYGWSMIRDTHHISLKECEKHLSDILAGNYDSGKYIIKEINSEE